ncbi:MAG: hypothetical protein AAGA89_03830 [Pseudomonadota bacterium]
MSRDDRPTLDRAWPIICSLISLLQVYVPRLTSFAPNRTKWQHLTRLAESLVRRWLVLNACQETGWPALATAQARRAPVPAPVTGRAAPAPRFRLQEAERALPRVWLYPETGGPLAPDAGDWAGWGGAVDLSLPDFNPARLRGRLAALTAVMHDPARHTLRMARWLARAAARRQQGPGRVCPFRVGWPPGASRAQKKRDPVWQALLSWLNHLAREALERGPPG